MQEVTSVSKLRHLLTNIYYGWQWNFSRRIDHNTYSSNLNQLRK